MDVAVGIGRLFLSGLDALLAGFDRALSCRELRSSYIKFSIQCFVIMMVGYVLVSATTMMLAPILLIVLLGPVAGPIAFAVFCYLSTITLIVLWAIGRFPSGLFVGSVGLLRPLFSVPQMSFLLSSMLLSVSIDEFMLLGIDMIHEKQQEKTNDDKISGKHNVIRSKYKQPSVFGTVSLAVNNAVFQIIVRVIMNRIILPIAFWFLLSAEKRKYLETTVVAAFLLGSQLASVYTVRIKAKRFWEEHTYWCFRNAPRIIAFTLPIQMLQHHSPWFYSFVWLGGTYFMASSLVEPLVVKDLQPKYDAKIY